MYQSLIAAVCSTYLQLFGYITNFLVSSRLLVLASFIECPLVLSYPFHTAEAVLKRSKNVYRKSFHTALRDHPPAIETVSVAMVTTYPTY